MRKSFKSLMLDFCFVCRWKSSNIESLWAEAFLLLKLCPLESKIPKKKWVPPERNSRKWAKAMGSWGLDTYCHYQYWSIPLAPSGRQGNKLSIWIKTVRTFLSGGMPVVENALVRKVIFVYKCCWYFFSHSLEPSILYFTLAQLKSFPQLTQDQKTGYSWPWNPLQVWPPPCFKQILAL